MAGTADRYVEAEKSGMGTVPVQVMFCMQHSFSIFSKQPLRYCQIPTLKPMPPIGIFL